MAPTPEELKTLWVGSVRRICSTDRYFVGPKWNKVFTNVSAWLAANPEINLLRFVEAQIYWCLRNRVRNAMWPNLMSGPSAYQRYQDEPDESQIVQDLDRRYRAQANAFIQLTNQVGLERALEDTMGSWSPLYLALVRHGAGLEIPPELRARAAQEARSESLINRVFPDEFIRSLA